MAKNTIMLKAYGKIIEERAAAATITPGMLLELTTSNTVQAHSTSEGNVFPAFALEDELQGNGINDNYSSGDQVQIWVPRRGDEVFAILADGEACSIGQFLSSNGDGYLKRHTTEEETWGVSEAGQVNVWPLQIVAVALEAKNLSGSSGAESSGPLAYNKRIEVKIV